MVTQIRSGGKWVHLSYIWIVPHLSAKNYRNWWKFDEVLTKTNLLSFFWDTVYVLYRFLSSEPQTKKTNKNRVTLSFCFIMFTLMTLHVLHISTKFEICTIYRRKVITLCVYVTFAFWPFNLKSAATCDRASEIDRQPTDGRTRFNALCGVLKMVA